MSELIAFLRAINVGGRTVKMEKLRAIFESCGFEDVTTHIASGNVLFKQPGKVDEAAVEAEIERALGFKSETFVRTRAEVREAVAKQPFGEVADEHAVHVLFLKEAPDKAARARLQEKAGDYDSFGFHAREVYWLCRGKVSDSKLTGAKIEKALGAALTARSLKMLRKLIASWD